MHVIVAMSTYMWLTLVLLLPDHALMEFMRPELTPVAGIHFRVRGSLVSDHNTFCIFEGSPLIASSGACLHCTHPAQPLLCSQEVRS